MEGNRPLRSRLHPTSFIQHPSLPHVIAWILACLTFPLIWAGGFVTTYRAGMAVPDWPTTFGYNMFLYPPESWLKVFDVFLEHSHRLMGIPVGLATIALAIVLWRDRSRRPVAWLGVAAVIGVSLQGVLGGVRVLADERFLAKVHGCSAPLFFAMAASLVALTSSRWSDGVKTAKEDSPRWFPRLALAVTVGIYLQIVAGAQLRHLSADEPLYWFSFWVWFHVIVACLALCGILAIAVVSWRHYRDEPTVARRVQLLLFVLVVQLLLGIATWVTNYGWPAWFTDYVLAIRYTVVAEGAAQAVSTTAHVAVGSLVLVIAQSLTLWSWRCQRREGGGQTV